MVALSLAAAQTLKERTVATGWTVAESSEYEAVIDHKVVHSGHGSLLLKSTAANAKDYERGSGFGRMPIAGSACVYRDG